MVDTNNSNFKYLERTKPKTRYVRLHYFFKSLVNFSLFTVVYIAFASLYLFVFYGGFTHPFFDYGPAMILDSWFLFAGLNVVGATVFAVAREKILLDNNEISFIDDSVNMMRGLVFKRKFSHPFKNIVKIDAHQSYFAKRQDLVKVEFILVDGSSFVVAVMDQDKFKKFEAKLSDKINKESRELLAALNDENEVRNNSAGKKDPIEEAVATT